jgi:hypothetical protein
MFTVETVEHMIQATADFGIKALSSINTGPLDHGGGRWPGLFAIRKLIKSSFNMIDTICNRTYIYSILLEDPAVDQQILKITKDDVIFSDLFRW